MAKKLSVKELDEKFNKFGQILLIILFIMGLGVTALIVDSIFQDRQLENLQNSIGELQEQRSMGEENLSYEETVIDCGDLVLLGEQAYDGSGELRNASVFFKSQGGVFQGDYKVQYYDRSQCQEVTDEWRQLTASQNLTMRGMPLQ